MNEAAFIKESLSQQNVAFYQEQGFLIANDALTPNEINTLNKELIDILSGKLGDIEGLQAQPKLDGADAALEVIRQYTAIHFPHKISKVIKDHAKHPRIIDALSKLVSPNVKCLQSMFFVKAPNKKGQAWHQDEYFIPTRDKSLIGVWLALDDASEENGCLWVIPGSHKQGVIRKRLSNTNDGFADTECADIAPYTQKDFVKVEVAKGAIVFFNGYLLHMSLQNRSENDFRRALVYHYSSAETMLPWDLDGRITPTNDYRDIFMVTGSDPYSYKGTADLAIPFIRPDTLDFSR